MTKVEQTLELIRLWHKYWAGEVYVAFSGGKDSTVLLHLVRSLYPEVPAVFSNTGLEFPEIVRFVRTFDNVTEIRPKMPFHKVLEKYGYPVISKTVSMAISRYRNTKREDQRQYRKWGKVVDGKKHTAGTIPKKYHHMIDAPFKICDACCQQLKKNPFITYERNSGLKPMIGIMAGDSHTRSLDIKRRGCNVYNAGKPQSRPLSKWVEEDIWNYITEHNLEICSVYGDNYDRTGCMFCLYGLQQEQDNTGQNRFQKMRVTHPQQYRFCMDKLGIREVLQFMGIPHE